MDGMGMRSNGILQDNKWERDDGSSSEQSMERDGYNKLYKLIGVSEGRNSPRTSGSYSIEHNAV